MRMLDGDEIAFTELVKRYQSTLVRVARYYVAGEASAEDVVQDTWIAVLRGLSKFEHRSSFKTWLLRILVNRAKTAGTRERRSIAIDLADPEAVASSRFDEHGAWSEPPVPFTDAIDESLANDKILRLVRQAINRLPDPHRAVVMLRDIEGLSTMEVAELLELSVANVRVILHRGRSRVRSDVEAGMSGGMP